MLSTTHSATTARRGQVTIDQLPPATLDEELAWICEYDNSGKPWADYICAARHKAVYGRWPDDTPAPFPNLPGGEQRLTKWLKGQSDPIKWQHARIEALRHQRTTELVNAQPDAPQIEAFPGQSEWMRLHHKRNLRSQLNQELKSVRRDVNRRQRLLGQRSVLRNWFEDNVTQASADEWKVKFLELRDVESQLAGEALPAFVKTPVETESYYEPLNVSVTSLGHQAAILANNEVRA
jgi:hypothetical protein